MDEFGELRIEDPPQGSALEQAVGHVIVNIRQLMNEVPTFPTGMLLDLNHGTTIAIANVGDELLCRSWPSPTWDQLGIRLGREEAAP